MDDKKIGEKPKGWFSRKHPTNAEHIAAVEKYKLNRGRAARRRKAAERNATPSEKLLVEIFSA